MDRIFMILKIKLTPGGSSVPGLGLYIHVYDHNCQTSLLVYIPDLRFMSLHRIIGSLVQEIL